MQYVADFTDVFKTDLKHFVNVRTTVSNSQSSVGMNLFETIKINDREILQQEQLNVVLISGTVDWNETLMLIE